LQGRAGVDKETTSLHNIITRTSRKFQTKPHLMPVLWKDGRKRGDFGGLFSAPFSRFLFRAFVLPAVTRIRTAQLALNCLALYKLYSMATIVALGLRSPIVVVTKYGY
jgi:hypothetical protein